MSRFQPDAIAESTIMLIICLLASVGNVSMFIVVLSNKHLKTISNYYVLSLAAADLLVVMLGGPVTASSMLKRKWDFGEAACTIFGFVTLLTFVASVNNLATIALNRYFFIVRWREYKQYFNKRRACLYGGITWGVSIFLSILPLFGWSQFAYIPEKSYCFVRWSADVYYMYFMVIICFCGPLTVMLVSYYKILVFTKSLKEKLFKSRIPNTPTSNKKSFMKREARVVSPEEVKLTNTLLIVVACFVVCWAPFAITMFFDVYHPVPIPRFVHVGSLLLGYLNSMCNPILYGIRNSSFKKGFKNLYSKCLPWLSKEEDITYFNSSGEGSSGENSATRSKVVKNVSFNHKNSFAGADTKQKSQEPDSRPTLEFNHKISPTLLEFRSFLGERRIATSNV